MYLEINTNVTKYLNLTRNQNRHLIVTPQQHISSDQKLLFFRNIVKTSRKQENFIKHINVKDINKRARDKILHISG